MEFKDVVFARKSVRAYKDTPVSKEIIADILKSASRAVNAHNYQPWEFIVATGDVLEKLREENLRAFRENAPQDNPDPVLGGVYKERSKELGIDLFTIMDIKRDDKDKRMWWSERGFGFFGAPAVIFVCLDEATDLVSCRLDAGAVIQSICLAATDAGLGTCVAYQAVNYYKRFYDILGVDKSKHFVCGIPIGYEDPSFAANSYISKRAEVDEVTLWAGF